MIRLAALFAVALIIFAADARAADITLCNETSSDLEYSFMWPTGTPGINQRWTIEGWYALSRNQCVKILDSPPMAKTAAYLSLVRKTDNGRRVVIHRRVDGEPARWGPPYGHWTIETSLCVADRPFKRTLGTVMEHRSCPGGYFGQLFNMLIVTKSQQDYVLTLN